jgi:uncharacterized protein
MSAQDVEFARLGYDLFNRGDLDGLVALCAPDIVWRDPGNPDTPDVTGHDGIRAYFETVLEPWEDLRREPEEIIDAGDRVLALWRMSARGRGSGIEIDMKGADVLTFRDGLLALWEAYIDRDAARAAVGLAEDEG